MNFVRVHRVIVEYTSSKTRRSFLLIILFVLCLLTLAVWKMDKYDRRLPIPPTSSLIGAIPINIETDQPRSMVAKMEVDQPRVIVTEQPKSKAAAQSLVARPVVTSAPLPVVTEIPIARSTAKPVIHQTVLPKKEVSTKPVFVVTGEPVNTTTAIPLLTTTKQLVKVVIYPRPFDYLTLEKDLCTARFPDVFVLIYVHTAPGNFEQRATIRDTWGNRNLYFRLRIATLFVLGRTVDENITTKIKQESQIHHDIIQEDFLDAYKNLTYKGVAALRWITNNCQNTPKFVLKVDDDMLVNTFEIVRFLRKAYKRKPDSDKFLCLFYNRNMPVMRDPKSKWYVSESDYPDKMYLPYCSGSAYIFPISIIPKLYNASFVTPFFWVDDVYVTGMLAQNANVTHESIGQLYMLYKGKNELADNIVFGNKVFGHFNIKPTKEWRYEFWKNITEVEQWMG